MRKFLMRTALAALSVLAAVQASAQSCPQKPARAGGAR
jgi:hypothetical protein